jgi:hypothetical protein
METSRSSHRCELDFCRAVRLSLLDNYCYVFISHMHLLDSQQFRGSIETIDRFPITWQYDLEKKEPDKH